MRQLVLDAPGRLVTLTGPGGCVKTQLALNVAAELMPHFADGVWLVDFANEHDGDLVPYAVAAALGRCGRARHSIEESLVAYLGAREGLLVFDNCPSATDGQNDPRDRRERARCASRHSGCRSAHTLRHEVAPGWTRTELYTAIRQLLVRSVVRGGHPLCRAPWRLVLCGAVTC